MSERLCVIFHASLRFIPTRHEIGFRRNPSTVSNWTRKNLDQSEMGGRCEMTYVFLGILEDECVATEDGGHEDLQFQGREVLTYTGPMIH